MSGTDGSNATQVGDDLKSFTIDHYAGESRPDMLSPDQDYIGYYRFATTLRVLFVTAVHQAEKSDGRIKRLHININALGGRGEGRYRGTPSNHFNEAEKRAIAEILKAAFQHDRKLLFAFHDRDAWRDDEIDVGSSMTESALSRAKRANRTTRHARRAAADTGRDPREGEVGRPET